MIDALVLTGGPHPFAETTPMLAELLELEACTVTVTEDPDGAAATLAAGSVDLLVLNTLRWTMRAERYASRREEHGYRTSSHTASAVDAWVRGGGRVLACHGAPICFDDWPGWGELLGARWSWERSSHPPLGPVEVAVARPDHPLVRDLPDFTIIDECYGFLEHLAPIEGLLTGEHGGATHPLLWEHRPGAGHVVVCLLGHGPESFSHPAHVEVLRRSIRSLSARPAGATHHGKER